MLVWTRRAFEERLSVVTSLPATVVLRKGSFLASDRAVFVEARSWLPKASEDVRAAEVARAAAPPLLDVAQLS